MSTDTPGDVKRRWASGTAFRMFVVLTLALLPLAVVAFLSNLNSIHAAQRQARQLLLAATEQSAGRLESQIMAVQTAQGLTVQTLANHVPVGDICGRMQVFVKGGRDLDGVDFIIVDRSGKVICGPGANGRIDVAEVLSLKTQADAVLTARTGGLLVRRASTDGRLIAATHYDVSFLKDIVRPLASDSGRHFTLRQKDRSLAWGREPIRAADHIFEATAPIGKTGLTLATTITDKSRATAQILALVVPMTMWLAAVMLGWIVVRWLLIQPLLTLRQAIGSYEPGQKLIPPATIFRTSREIAELGASFEAMSEQVLAHGEDMKRALDRQTKLTREVHHRVKNNLQIISSLISLHARAADDPHTTAAYVSIQRRVDSLAVVQRNHYAELEESKGVSAQPVLTEIAASLKASVPPEHGDFNIQIDCDPVYLHQDVAAPVAFLIAELADEAITKFGPAKMRIALISDPESAGHAYLVIASDAFLASSRAARAESPLVERVLTGLSRQLRSPLEYDGDTGEYRIRLSVI